MLFLKYGNYACGYFKECSSLQLIGELRIGELRVLPRKMFDSSTLSNPVLIDEDWSKFYIS